MIAKRDTKRSKRTGKRGLKDVRPKTPVANRARNVRGGQSNPNERGVRRVNTP
jgi:hypothetical protein